MDFALRPMTPIDLPQVLELQAACYPPALHDEAPAFESRLALAPAMNLVAVRGDTISGYLISHPWTTASPPPVNAILDPPEGVAQCWFIHDLSVAPSARGAGLGGRLIQAGAQAARAAGLDRSELIAVEGAADFWLAQGWSAVKADAALAAKVAGYGALAAYMAKSL